MLIEIKGISEEEWESFRNRILPIADPYEKIKVGENSILLDKRYRNKLFVKGIYVCELPDDYHFGYDLKISINRDREVSDPWTLRETIQTLIVNAVEKDLISLDRIWDILNQSNGEAGCFRYTFNYGDFNKRVSRKFEELYGKDALPVPSIGESQRAEAFGHKGIVVNDAIKKIIEVEQGSFEERLKYTKRDPIKYYSFFELTPIERSNIFKICEIISNQERWFSMDNVSIVDFNGEKIRGLFRKKSDDSISIFIAKRLLSDAVETIRTLVHEVAHKYGEDAFFSHEEKQHEIMAKIIADKIRN